LQTDLKSMNHSQVNTAVL